jgi:hypothetical protein
MFIRNPDFGQIITDANPYNILNRDPTNHTLLVRLPEGFVEGQTVVPEAIAPIIQQSDPELMEAVEETPVVASQPEREFETVAPAPKKKKKVKRRVVARAEEQADQALEQVAPPAPVPPVFHPPVAPIVEEPDYDEDPRFSALRNAMMALGPAPAPAPQPVGPAPAYIPPYNTHSNGWIFKVNEGYWRPATPVDYRELELARQQGGVSAIPPEDEVLINQAVASARTRFANNPAAQLAADPYGPTHPAESPFQQ